MDRRTVLLCLIVPTVLLAVVAGGAVAQESTPSPTPPASTPADAGDAGDASTTYVAQVDPGLRVVSVDYSDGLMRIVFEADVPRTVRLAGPAEGEGTASTFPIKEVAIPSGRTEVTFPAQVVAVSTPRAWELGKGTYLDATPEVDPTAGLSSNAALLIGAGTGLGWVVLAGAVSLRREDNVPKELSRGGHKPGEDRFKKSIRGILGWAQAWLVEHWMVTAGLAGSAAVVLVATDASLPSPPLWLESVAISSLILALPCYLAGRRLYKWWRDRAWVEVSEEDGLRDLRRFWIVPPVVWEDKTVANDKPPNPIGTGADYAVRSLEWHDSIGELEVEGSWPGEAKVGDLTTEKEHFEAIHEVLSDAYRAFKRLRARWSRMARQMEGAILNEQAEAQERGEMMEPTAAKEIWEEHAPNLDEDPIDEKLPDLPTAHDELSTVEDGPDPLAEPGENGAGGEQ